MRSRSWIHHFSVCYFHMWWYLFPHLRGFGKDVRPFIFRLRFFPFFLKVEISSHTLISLFCARISPQWLSMLRRLWSNVPWQIHMYSREIMIYFLIWKHNNKNPSNIGSFLDTIIIIIICPLTARVVLAPKMISQPVSSIFPCSPLPSGTLQIPGLSIPWCCLPTSPSVCLASPLSLCLARWFQPDLMNGKHDHTTAVCVSLWSSGDLCVVQLPAGSWHGLPCW